MLALPNAFLVKVFSGIISLRYFYVVL